jgi:hypothetical protein
VAVYDLAAAGDIKPRTASVVSEAILAEIRKYDGVSAIGMKEIGEMLAFEQKKQFVGCDSMGCLVELAGALGVDELVTGNLGALGESHVITVKRMDLNTAETKSAVSKTLKKGSGEEFLAVVGDVTKELYSDKKLKEGVKAGVSKQTVARLTKPPLPTWVFYTTAGVTVAAAGAGLFFALTGNSALGDYNSLVEKSISGQPVDGQLLKKKRQEVDNDYMYANAMFITAGVLAAAAIVEAVFTDWKPDPVRPTVTPMASLKGDVGVNLAWKW